MQHQLKDEDYKRINDTLMKISCPICNVYPIRINAFPSGSTGEICLIHVEHFNKLHEEYVKLKKEAIK